MSVTLSTPPPALAFSRNQIPVVLTSDDVIGTAGVIAVNYITFAGAVGEGNTINLVWAGANITMTAANAPDNSGLQFPPGDGSAGYVASLVDYFSQNFFLDRDFVITAAGTRLVLTGQLTGIDNNLVPVTTGNIAVTNPISGVTQTLKANAGHYLGVWLNGQNIFSRTLALDYPAASGITTKNIAEILHPHLGSDKPDLSASGLQACPNTLQSYFLKYGQYYGDNPVVQRIYKSDTYFVNRGALDLETSNGQTVQGFLSPSGLSNTICLRQGSKTILVQTDQPEFLYWINLTGADQQLSALVNLYLTDGSSYFFDMPALAVGANQKAYLPVSFLTLAKVRIPIGKACSSYDVRFKNTDGTFLSKTYTYLLDQYREFPRYFIYLNSLGGYQTLYTWGRAENSMGRTKTDISRQVSDQEAATYGRDQETTIRIRPSTIVNTGYNTQRDILLLNDFLASEEKYMVSNGRLVPIGISSDKVDLPKDGDSLNAAQFEFYPLFDDWAFTDDPTQPDGTINGAGSTATGGYNLIKDNDNDNNLYYDNLP